MKMNYSFFRLTNIFGDFEDLWCFNNLAIVTQFQPINIPALAALI